MPASLSDEKWMKILNFLIKLPCVYVGNDLVCRRFVEGVLWMLRSGAPWRFLPHEYGNWNTIYKRYVGWCDRNVWEQMHHAFIEDPDLENIIPDSTIIRAHACAAGAPKERGGQEAQALGRSRGGFSSKIHVITDGLGNPLRAILTPGQSADITQGPKLIEGFKPDNIPADKGYDSQAFVQLIEKSGANAVIPSRKSNKKHRDYDKHVYKERHLVECLIGKIKHYRRVFSRFDKIDSRFFGFLSFSFALIWLR